ncbi:ATP12 family chaperone protein [Thalassovita taeanensis]|uniref:Chaperone required for the assembly of the F1-ATPase n=1 Tax=Thalassovita taeanensis TaxID=657014 RepID=A0A1H9DY17_9RHOB|nr:ATP12 family protein [Thalassovita taeanensis]SEQ18379.1 Chaperone required for the assembly of the F1-ATPase [Thalassovita taeanensis]
MSNWKAKRFWKEASVTEADDGFTVQLDGRPVRTPAKTLLVVPTRAMALAVADEWDAQEGEIKPQTMPVTRSANAALDKVAQQHDEVAALIADYGGTDLLCYRAPAPQELIARQAAAWDPILDWAEQSLGVRLICAEGVMHIAQDPEGQCVLQARVRAMDPFRLTAFHDLVSLSGSLVLGFAAVHDLLPPQQIWALSRIDELWQEEQWGADDEATALAETKQMAFLHAKSFHDLCAPAF